MKTEDRRIKSLAFYDIWDETEGTKQSRAHPSTKRAKRSALPHPGQSYNPDPDDHAKLIKRVAHKELQYQKEQRAIRRAQPAKVDKEELRKHEERELVSGIRHLVGKDANESGDETDSVYSDYDDKDFEVILKDKKVREKRKTKQQRLARLRDKTQRKEAKMRKSKNIRLSKLDAVKKIAKELDKEEKEAKTKQTKRHRKRKCLRLGPKFEQTDPIYCLSSELPSTLREVSCPLKAIVREQLVRASLASL